MRLPGIMGTAGGFGWCRVTASGARAPSGGGGSDRRSSGAAVAPRVRRHAPSAATRRRASGMWGDEGQALPGRVTGNHDTNHKRPRDVGLGRKRMRLHADPVCSTSTPGLAEQTPFGRAEGVPWSQEALGGFPARVGRAVSYVHTHTHTHPTYTYTRDITPVSLLWLILFTPRHATHTLPSCLWAPSQRQEQEKERSRKHRKARGSRRGKRALSRRRAGASLCRTVRRVTSLRARAKQHRVGGGSAGAPST